LLKRQFNSFVHCHKWRRDRLSVSNGEVRGLQIAKSPSAFCRALAIPRENRRKREKQFEHAGRDDTQLRRECVSSNERTIPDIEKGQVPRRVTGRKDSLKRANAVAVHEKACGTRFRAGETNQFLSGFTSIQRVIASEEARFSLANREFDTWKLLDYCVQSTNVVYVSVRQGYASDRRIEASRGFQDARRCACQAGVNESEAVIFADKKTIDHS
jgi:hypothetical protein